MDRNLQHQAQEANRARIARANRHLKLALNTSIKEDAKHLIHVHVRLSIILWMAWLEASVLWLACHPRVDNADRDITLAKKTHEQKWRALVERLAARQPRARRSSCGTLLDWVNGDIRVYAELRNKLAHGQWEVCLTSDHAKRNPATTKRVLELTKGDVLKLKAVAEELVDLTERLIVSPAAFDVELPKSRERIDTARRQYSGDIEWLLSELRRKRRRI